MVSAGYKITGSIRLLQKQWSDILFRDLYSTEYKGFPTLSPQIHFQIIRDYQVTVDDGLFREPPTILGEITARGEEVILFSE